MYKPKFSFSYPILLIALLEHSCICLQCSQRCFREPGRLGEITLQPRRSQLSQERLIKNDLELPPVCPKRRTDGAINRSRSDFGGQDGVEPVRQMFFTTRPIVNCSATYMVRRRIHIPQPWPTASPRRYFNLPGWTVSNS